MRKPIAIIVLLAALALAISGCTTGVAQQDVDDLRAEVRALQTEVSQLQEIAITTENVGDVVGTAIKDWGGQIVRDAVEEMGNELMANLREQMKDAVAEAIGSAVGDTLGDILPSFGKE